MSHVYLVRLCIMVSVDALTQDEIQEALVQIEKAEQESPDLLFQVDCSSLCPRKILAGYSDAYISKFGSVYNIGDSRGAWS